MIVTTMEDWNALLEGCGCCPMPVCPVPDMECESLTGSASRVGFYEEAEGMLYSRKIFRDTHTWAPETGTAEHPDGSGTYTTYTGSGSGTDDFIQEYVGTGAPANAEISVGGCQTKTPTFETSCGGSGDYGSMGYEGWVAGTSSGVDLINEQTGSITFVGGEDDGEGGAYPACYFRHDYSATLTDHCHASPESPPGFCDGYPITETTTTQEFGNSVSGFLPAGYTTEATVEMEAGTNRAGWISSTESAILTLLDFEDEDNAPCIGEACHSARPGIGEEEWSAELTKVRYRWRVPDTHEGSYFKVTWDVLEEPEGWDDPEPTASRVWVAQDLTWEWTGPGDPEDDDSWRSGWYELPPPAEAGIRRVVNVRFQCYTSTRIGGGLVQTTGEGVEL